MLYFLCLRLVKLSRILEKLHRIEVFGVVAELKLGLLIYRHSAVHHGLERGRAVGSAEAAGSMLDCSLPKWHLRRKKPKKCQLDR